MKCFKDKIHLFSHLNNFHNYLQLACNLYLIITDLSWLPDFVLLRLRVPFVLERLSAIKVQLELELSDLHGLK